MTDLLVTSTVMSPAADIVVPAQSVITLLATGETVKNPVADSLPTNLTNHPPAKGVAEVTLQATS